MKKLLVFCLYAVMTLHLEAQISNNLLTPESLWKIGRVGLEAVSPNGQYAVYGVQRFDLESNKSTRTLYLILIKTGESRPLTDPKQSAESAMFHPGGKKIGFLRDGKLCEVNIEGAPVVKSVSELEINGFLYAPDGKRILFIQDVQHEARVQQTHQDLPQATGRVFDGLLYRHWKSWSNQKYSNIFYSNYENGLLTGSPVNIMNEPFHSPLKPMGGMEQICWSPDGRHIAYTCRKLKGAEAAQSTNSDIYLYDLTNGQTTNLTPDLPGYDLEPVFSPDGRYIAWTSMERPGYEADRTRLMVLDLNTRKRTELTEGWSYEANHPQWAADGQSLYFLSSKDFTYQLCQVQWKDRSIRVLTEGQHDYGAFKLAGGQIIAPRTSMAQPAEIYAFDLQTAAVRQLSHATDETWAGIAKGKVERRTVRTKDGNNLNVWMIYPPNFNPSEKYPALLFCQGGPQSPLSQGFSYRWNFQLMASKGYVVIAPCRRGMPGAGQAWCDAIRGDWGGGAMQDLLDATDYAAKEPYIDASRVGAVGASFGGYAVYWLAGNHKKRFKTFIAHCGLFNLESFYGATEEVWFPHYDFEGAYWQPRKPDMYAKHSPHLFVQNWDTPILVIHNELDFRVPFGEGMQAFQAAQLRGIPSRFLSFPDEGHWMSKAQNSVLWQRVFFEWLDAYLR